MYNQWTVPRFVNPKSFRPQDFRATLGSKRLPVIVDVVMRNNAVGILYDRFSKEKHLEFVQSSVQFRFYFDKCSVVNKT